MSLRRLLRQFRARRPDPRRPTEFERRQIETIAFAFDRAFYCASHPDVALSGVDPVLHFVRQGWREGRDPHPDFSTRWYLEVYPDVAAAGVNPFVHFTKSGRAEGRSGRPPPEPTPAPEEPAEIAASELVAPEEAEVADIEPAEIAVLREVFDADHYRKTYPALDLGGEDPLHHYCRIGWRTGLDPNAGFDTTAYLAAYPDVAAAGVNPLLHYVVHGRSEGRSPTPSRHPIRTAILLAAEQAECHPSRPAGGPEIEADTILRAFDAMPVTARTGLVVVVSHDDFRAGQGGVQNCVAQEFRAAKASGWAFLNVVPAGLGCGLAEPAEATGAMVRLAFDDGPPQAAGFDVLRDVLVAVRARGTPVHLIIHHLMGHSPEALAAVARDLNLPVTLWAHDFFLLCRSFALQRNGIAFCGAPPVESNACRICAFGPGRARHRARMDRFLKQVEPNVAVPSVAVLQLLRTAGLVLDEAAVLPPVAIESGLARPSTHDQGRPLRVAHVGSATALKGWPAFERLTGLPGVEDRYAFYHVGTHPPLGGRVTHVTATVTPDRPDAVVEALLEIEVDIVVNWTSCFETFSFVTHEALAAGAFVIVPRGSGHAAAVAAATGLVLDDEQALTDAFVSGRLIDRYVEARRRGLRTGRLVPTGPRSARHVR